MMQSPVCRGTEAAGPADVSTESISAMKKSSERTALMVRAQREDEVTESSEVLKLPQVCSTEEPKISAGSWSVEPTWKTSEAPGCYKSC